VTAGFLILLGAATFFAADCGTFKTHWDWVDLLGEFASFLAVVMWLPVTMRWRPAGPVTDALCIGLCCLAFGFYLDWLDEFINFSNSVWGSAESVVTPLGLLILTLALTRLSQEQTILNRTLLGREAGIRNHRAIDATTDLYAAEYLRKVLAGRLKEDKCLDLRLVALRDCEGAGSNSKIRIDDRVLRQIASFLVASVPPETLVCRYAGDCFVVLAGRAQNLDHWADHLTGTLSRFAAMVDEPKPDQKELGCAVIRPPVLPDDIPQTLLSRAIQLLNERDYAPCTPR
jgi:GGDEF domain-containing protein